MPPDESLRPIQLAAAMRLDRLTGEEALEILPQMAGRAVALPGRLAERHHHDRVEVAAQLAPESFRRHPARRGVLGRRRVRVRLLGRGAQRPRSCGSSGSRSQIRVAASAGDPVAIRYGRTPTSSS